MALPPTSPPSPDQPPGTQRAARPWSVAALGLAVGIALGVVVGYVVFDPGSRTAAEVEVACGIAGELDGFDFEEDLGQIDENPVIWRMQAISPLLMAASIDDDHYDDAAEAAQLWYGAFRTLDQEELSQAIGELNNACDEL